MTLHRFLKKLTILASYGNRLSMGSRSISPYFAHSDLDYLPGIVRFVFYSQYSGYCTEHFSEPVTDQSGRSWVDMGVGADPSGET